jgi:hypothetical protein
MECFLLRICGTIISFLAAHPSNRAEFFGSGDCPSEPDDLAVLEERTEQLIPTDHKAQSPSRGSPQSESFLPQDCQDHRA